MWKDEGRLALTEHTKKGGGLEGECGVARGVRITRAIEAETERGARGVDRRAHSLQQDLQARRARVAQATGSRWRRKQQQHERRLTHEARAGRGRSRRQQRRARGGARVLREAICCLSLPAFSFACVLVCRVEKQQQQRSGACERETRSAPGAKGAGGRQLWSARHSTRMRFVPPRVSPFFILLFCSRAEVVVPSSSPTRMLCGE